MTQKETGIGMEIRNYSKESGKIRDKARIVYHKRKGAVAESVPTSTKQLNVKPDNRRKVHSSKEKAKIRNKAPLTEIDSLSNAASKKTSANFVSINIDNSSLNQKYPVNDVSNEPLYTYEKPEGGWDYIEYDPRCNINLGYSPDHPELYPESRDNSLKKEYAAKLKHTVHSQKSISPSSAKKRKSEYISEKSNGHISKSKKTKTGKMQLTSPEAKSYKNGLDSETLKIKKDLKRDTSEKLSPEPAEFKRTKHEKAKSKSEKNKCSGDSKQKESKHTSANSSTHKLHKKTEKNKSKSKLNLKVKEEFTSSEFSFEDCLGFNDIISVRKKKSGSKSSSKKRDRERDSVLKMNPEVSSERKKDSSLTTKALVENSNTVLHVASALPQMQPNKRPLEHRSPECIPHSAVKKKVMTNEEAIKFTSSKKEKTAVYSGRRNNIITEVTTLFSACMEVLIDNIDAIECLGDTPYFLVKPVMERCTPAQLLNIENFNPLFLDETQELWEVHCRRDFRNRKPDENETWRDMYLRLLDEREKRLKSVTANISASMSKSAPSVRKAKLAYVDSVAKPPRDVARKQAKHGTALPVNQPMKVAPPSKAAPRPTAPAINPAASTSGAVALKKPKVAPLMAKTLKSLKQCFRR